MTKRSKQRDAILSFLMTRKDHPTADVIYENVRREYPNISLGTVYRNLTLLAELGHVMKVPCNDGTEHFDSTVKPHYHFECTQCKAIIDMDNISPEVSDALDTIALKGFDGSIKGHKLFFYGECADCKTKRENVIDSLNTI